jgi:hypothetical protein
MARKFPIIVAILALAALACGFNMNLPERREPGPEVTETIEIPYPAEDEVSLTLSFGAGDMKVSPGAGGLLEGTVTYNYEELKPEIAGDGGEVRLEMGGMEFKGFPNFGEIKNEWDLKLGSEPMSLVIEAGAYDGEFELGGLALTRLTVKDGAANVEMTFSKPNQEEMSLFSYSTGASDVTLRSLANANFSLFDFSAGAGDYVLDFSGQLRRDASVKVETGFSNLIIVVPEGVRAIVRVEGGASNVNAGSGWERSGNVYEQDGEGPRLTFAVEMSAGNLTLTR